MSADYEARLIDVFVDSLSLEVKIYSDDLNSCNEPDNLIADGIVEVNTHGGWTEGVKWNCRINVAGVFNESQNQ